MEITITRFYNEKMEVANGFIERDEWITFIKQSDLLERDAVTTGKNPLTGSPIAIGPQTDIGWLVDGTNRFALQYNDGDIWVECHPYNEIKHKIARIAQALDAIVLNEDREIQYWL